MKEVKDVWMVEFAGFRKEGVFFQTTREYKSYEQAKEFMDKWFLGFKSMSRKQATLWLKEEGKVNG